jgi:hypothetical protein
MNTADEHFNANVQFWYFRFSGNNKPKTEKPFEVFLKALHEVYFFIQENLNKPFGCIEKINNVSQINGFNEVEKLVLIDYILGILSHHPEQGKQLKVIIQLVDLRNDLSPFIDEIFNEATKVINSNDMGSNEYKVYLQTEGIDIDFTIEQANEQINRYDNAFLDDYFAPLIAGTITLKDVLESEKSFHEVRLNNAIQMGFGNSVRVAKHCINIIKSRLDTIDETNKPIILNESKTKKVILETFKIIDKKGWQYAFISEQEYNLFADLLTNFFEYKPYKLPETSIQLKRSCKTKVAKALGEIHQKLSNENKLITDKDYFKIIRVLSHFKDEIEGDLYKALTR